MAEKKGFTAEEKAAMRARAKELKEKEDGETAVRAAIAAMSPQDRALAKRVDELVTGRRARAHAEDVVRDARLRNKDGKVVVFFKNAGQVQVAVLEPRLQRQRESRCGVDVADGVRA